MITNAKPRHRSTTKPKTPRCGKSNLDWLDRRQRGCEAWQEPRTLRGRLATVSTIMWPHESRERYAIDVVSRNGRRRRVLLDDDHLAMRCRRWQGQWVAVRAYREDGKWELDTDTVLGGYGTAAIRREIKAQPRRRLMARRNNRIEW